jgi:hypothetical protein
MGDGVAMLRANETEVVVAAPGYESVHKTSDQAIDGVLNFELTTSASMQVFWSPPAEMDDSVHLRLRSDGHLFADESPAASKLRREFGAPLMAWAKMPPADGSRGGLINWPLKKSQKEFLIRGLAVNETLEIQIVGRLGHVLSASPPFTLGHGESRQITLPPFAPSVELRGQVVDVDGNALSNAEVGLRAEQKRTFTYTDANGRFRFGSLSPITVDLSVKAAGFESYSLKSVEISAGRAPLQITLKPTE